MLVRQISSEIKKRGIIMGASLANWDKVSDKLFDIAADLGLKIVLAIIVFIVGSFIIRKLVKIMGSLKTFKNIDPTAGNYIITFVKYALYTVLLVSIVALLGVPMSSVIALIASIGVAIGMAMQGSLANIAGGIMLLVFRPFSVGDYIVASTGEEGYVKTISLVYTVLRTFDNRIISVPNGGLMNASISNNTVEPLRRVDLAFDISGSEPADKVADVIMKAVLSTDKVLSDPAPQVVPASTVTDGLTYAVRVWVKTDDYWNVHAELMSKIPVMLNGAKIARPETPVRLSNN